MRDLRGRGLLAGRGDGVPGVQCRVLFGWRDVELYWVPDGELQFGGSLEHLSCMRGWPVLDCHRRDGVWELHGRVLFRGACHHVPGLRRWDVFERGRRGALPGVRDWAVSVRGQGLGVPGMRTRDIFAWQGVDSVRGVRGGHVCERSRGVSVSKLLDRIVFARRGQRVREMPRRDVFHGNWPDVLGWMRGLQGRKVPGGD